MKKILMIFGIMIAIFAGSNNMATAALNTTNQSLTSYESPLVFYKPMYFIAGNQQDQVKAQVSFALNAFYMDNPFAFLGYTQLSWWKCYQDSDTFSTNYQPEVFVKFLNKDNIFDLAMGPIDYLQFSPIQHSSTGVEGEDHRSINIYYAQVQASTGEKYNFGANLKLYGYYSISDQNEDINDYRKNYEADLFFKLKSKTTWYVDKFELHARAVGNPFDKGYYVLEGICQIFTSKFQPKLFVQYNKGYGINMVTYNKKETELRAGITF